MEDRNNGKKSAEQLYVIICVVMVILLPMIIKGWNHLRLQSAVGQVRKNIKSATSNLTPQDNAEAYKAISEGKALYLSKLDPGERVKAEYFIQCSASGTCTDEDLMEQATLLKKAKSQYNLEEMMVWNKCQELVYKMSKLKKTPDSI